MVKLSPTIGGNVMELSTGVDMRFIGLTKIVVLLIGNHNIICVVKRIELLADPNHPVLCDNSRTSPKLLSYLCTFEVWIRKQ